MKKNAECDVVPSTTDDEDDDSGIGSLFQTDVVHNSPVLPEEVVSPVAGSHIDTESVLVDTVPVSRDMLSEAQRGDPELKPLFARAVDLNESEKLSKLKFHTSHSIRRTTSAHYCLLMSRFLVMCRSHAEGWNMTSC
ncbi:hypothetical protein Pcinc_007507 [Petrolisthes cinctipes]|uniref:Uncharacterized protein n=1 Tax=Petrolisthes cinctipes TaxID=88211 RepID=A0AAE1GF12_PETCI|nr:hypothetical protein Pcinc_007507 [Petrolisthes cinctipes]